MLCSILFSTERIKGDEKVELQQRRTIVTGALLLSNIMAGMDGTIVNTALPAITSDLHGLQYMGWIIATFLLGMAVATPLWSKFGEHKGNKQAYITATSMFLVGAIFQGLAPNILWFIIARTVMGIGAGGMNTIPFIVFAELYDNLKKRAQVLGIASACFGTASIIGPLLGGWIVDALSLKILSMGTKMHQMRKFIMRQKWHGLTRLFVNCLMVIKQCWMNRHLIFRKGSVNY